jgi:hypothetical protein
MSVYRHCSGCGRGYNQQAWQKESFCGSCGEPLKNRISYEEPLDIHPYPERNSPQGLRLELSGLIDQLGRCAKTHPYLFSAGALATGAGAILLGPGLVTLGQGVMLIGGILLATGMLSVVYVEKGQAEKWIAAGLLTLVAGTGIALVGFALTIVGVIAVVGGTGLAVKETATQMLRRRIEKKIREKSISQLIDISRQLDG